MADEEYDYLFKVSGLLPSVAITALPPPPLLSRRRSLSRSARFAHTLTSVPAMLLL